ncbi:Histone-lysine N-methyltransferase, H3 lysine-79 specific like [Actinidia chinensis var. chinensis]|uniref:Histone-lysine N-methyltransferase, H3 lysine-79 specific like n=1 Tax=Actinidia chinensis var. chinensis TaxID=1590841 RepID=A0A2R6PAX1_ACTCC|nr:Histone-lysine N-methyltransferase, H3 lysine-79 specific like [Actinidia chinensis var. chinensis]
MKTTSLQLLYRPTLSFFGRVSHRKVGAGQRKRHTSRFILACGKDYNGSLVDENMVVLRQRIREMKVAEREYVTPRDWMEWEKRYVCGSYDSDVCEAMGLLQSTLMETRPCLALGIVALIVFSMSTFTTVVIFTLVEMTMAILAGVQLG